MAEATAEENLKHVAECLLKGRKDLEEVIEKLEKSKRFSKGFWEMRVDI